MKMHLARAAAALLLTTIALGANAASVTVASPGLVDSGSSFQVTVDVAGLSGAANDSLGAYDLQLSYDSALLAVTSIVFGGALGTSLQLSDSTFPGEATATEVSFEDPSFLDASQPGAFTLFTITFDALASGTSALSLAALGPFANSDGLGELGFDLVSGSVTVGSPVPLPAAAWLLLSGVGGLLVAGRRRVVG